MIPVQDVMDPHVPPIPEQVSAPETTQTIANKC
jgi:hypothetical protein